MVLQVAMEAGCSCIGIESDEIRAKYAEACFIYSFAHSALQKMRSQWLKIIKWLGLAKVKVAESYP